MNLSLLKAVQITLGNKCYFFNIWDYVPLY